MAFNDTKSPGDLITSQDWNDFVDYTEGISGQLSLHTSNNNIHLTSSQKAALTNGGDTSLHYHSSDRDLANATGILSISHGGTNNTSFTSGKFIAYDGSKLASTSYNESSFAAANHNHDASDITSGTLAYERGGLNTDVSSFKGLIKISGGATTYISDRSNQWDVAYNHSQITAGNPHEVQLSELTDVQINSPLKNGHFLGYINAHWQNLLMPITFSTPAIGLKGNRYIKLARFKLPEGKTFYIWQASISDVDGNSVADLKIEALGGDTVIYSTSSNERSCFLRRSSITRF